MGSLSPDSREVAPSWLTVGREEVPPLLQCVRWVRVRSPPAGLCARIPGEEIHTQRHPCLHFISAARGTRISPLNIVRA